MFEQTMARVAPHATSIDDETLLHRVYRALDSVEPLHVLGSPVRVQVNDGVVTLSGVVATYPIKVQALQATRDVLGVQQVRDELLTDSELEIRIAHALSTDPRTQQAAFYIIVDAVNGLVGLVGQVPTSGIAQTAETIATGVSGVRAVSNRLQIGQKRDKGNAHFVGG